MKSISVLLGENIRRERTKLKINQEKLALSADIDRSYMGRIERGEVNITLEKLYKICLILECEPTIVLPKIEEVAIK